MLTVLLLTLYWMMIVQIRNFVNKCLYLLNGQLLLSLRMNIISTKLRRSYFSILFRNLHRVNVLILENCRPRLSWLSLCIEKYRITSLKLHCKTICLTYSPFLQYHLYVSAVIINNMITLSPYSKFH